MGLETAVTYARTHQADFLEELCHYLKIPSISTLSQHHPDVLQAAQWLQDSLRQIGLEHVQQIETAGNPVVYADWLHAGPDAPTVLVYGHYDVQPVEPLAAWTSPPFTPVVRDGRLYARGVSDNKAQHFSHLKALEAMLQTAGKLPVNVKICFDGEEEVGSPNLAPFVEANQTLLAADFVVVSDGAMHQPDQPTIDYALRGVVAIEIRVTGPNRDLHSGSYGGSVHNPAQAVAEIVAALHHPDGRVAIPGFYDDVDTLSPTERDLLQKVPYSLSQWQTETGAAAAWGEPAFTFFERMTARPTCEVNGIWGGFAGEGFKTIIPAEAGAKISMRLVENQDADKIAQQLTQFVGQLTPPTVTVEVTVQAGADAAVTPYDSAGIQAAFRAYEDGWEATPLLSRGGGSLPIVATFQKLLGAPFVLMPFGLDDNRHSPNEHYHLTHLEKGIVTAVYFYHHLASAVTENSFS
ncbi:MAG: peptidase M20 [Anaerolineaceae bacterium]|nr:peptidase M20 [Anaerolineaceae bacterium]